jgi:hypothetical protein
VIRTWRVGALLLLLSIAVGAGSVLAGVCELRCARSSGPGAAGPDSTASVPGTRLASGCPLHSRGNPATPARSRPCHDARNGGGAAWASLCRVSSSPVPPPAAPIVDFSAAIPFLPPARPGSPAAAFRLARSPGRSSLSLILRV